MPRWAPAGDRGEAATTEVRAWQTTAVAAVLQRLLSVHPYHSANSLLLDQLQAFIRAAAVVVVAEGEAEAGGDTNNRCVLHCVALRWE